MKITIFFVSTQKKPVALLPLYKLRIIMEFGTIQLIEFYKGMTKKAEFH